jgi:hypothetical protein
MRLGLPASAPSDSVKSISLWELVNTRPPPEPDYWAKKPSFWPKKPSLFARSVKLAKLGLMALGIASIGALAGIGNYFFNGVPGTPLLTTEDTSSPANGSAAPSSEDEFSADHLTIADEPPPPHPTPEPPSAPPNERLAALLDQSETSTNIVPPAILTQVSMLRGAPRDEAAVPVADEALPLSDDAPLPRARPNEPVFTGSIARSVSEPQRAAERKAARPGRLQRFGPCATLRNLRIPYLFGNRCRRYTQSDPAPPGKDIRVVAAPSPVPARQYSPQPYQPPRMKN